MEGMRRSGMSSSSPFGLSWDKDVGADPVDCCRYGLKSVFMQGIPPPTIHIHLRIIDPTDGSIPGVPIHATVGKGDEPVLPGLATDEEAKAFGEWLRGRWADKETLMDGFTAGGWKGFQEVKGGEEGDKKGLYGEGSVRIPIRL